MAIEKEEDLEADVAKHSSKLEADVARSTFLTARFQRFSRSGAVYQRGSCNDLCVPCAVLFSPKPNPTLSRVLGECRRHLRPFGTNFGASFAQRPAAPEVHLRSRGAGSSTIGMLEEVESDFSKDLAELSVAEDEAEIGYQKITKENIVTKASEEQDVMHKEQESANLKKAQ